MYMYMYNVYNNTCICTCICMCMCICICTHTCIWYSFFLPSKTDKQNSHLKTWWPQRTPWLERLRGAHRRARAVHLSLGHRWWGLRDPTRSAHGYRTGVLAGGSAECPALCAKQRATDSAIDHERVGLRQYEIECDCDWWSRLSELGGWEMLESADVAEANSHGTSVALHQAISGTGVSVKFWLEWGIQLKRNRAQKTQTSWNHSPLNSLQSLAGELWCSPLMPDRQGNWLQQDPPCFATHCLMPGLCMFSLAPLQNSMPMLSQKQSSSRRQCWKPPKRPRASCLCFRAMHLHLFTKLNLPQ